MEQVARAGSRWILFASSERLGRNNESNLAPRAGSLPSHRKYRQDHEEKPARQREGNTRVCFDTDLNVTHHWSTALTDCKGREGLCPGVCERVHQLHHERVGSWVDGNCYICLHVILCKL